jgi:hypothetical protein
VHRGLRVVALTAGLVAAAGSSDALAWGCEGHEAVAIVAERLLDPAAVRAVRALLAASPPDAQLERLCDPVPGSALAHASTWADDYRATNQTTAVWHFINVPRVAGNGGGDYRQYCPRGNCILDAIVAHYGTLATATDQTARADALRYIIHFIGDLHQPLHAITNGDRGGTCLPLTHRGRRPREGPRLSYAPNLHYLWDAGLVRGLMDDRRFVDANALADYVLNGRAARAVAAEEPTGARVASWARESNEVARTIVYGRLPAAVAMEPAEAVRLSSCADNNAVSRRLARLDVRINGAYEAAALPVIVERIRLGGERLAATLAAAMRNR